ncbi:MAG: ParB N-terminal domain-containing protein [Candidatus Brocadiales bacterium]|nr:ParB N-terminal domain-containing protein [Candidatus Brocadiales bacterium]
MAELKTLKISELKPNKNNPRVVKDEKFNQLVDSLKNFPEMTSVRSIVINMENEILGGNMRYRAMKSAGWKEAPVIQVDWPKEKQEEFIIKDNVNSGNWDYDLLANEWESEKLADWGIDAAYWGNDGEAKQGNVNDPDKEWDGMPEYQHDDQTPFKQILVSFRNEADLKAFAKLVEQNVMVTTKSIWYPRAKDADVADIAYKNDETT